MGGRALVGHARHSPGHVRVVLRVAHAAAAEVGSVFDEVTCEVSLGVPISFPNEVQLHVPEIADRKNERVREGEGYGEIRYDKMSYLWCPTQKYYSPNKPKQNNNIYKKKSSLLVPGTILTQCGDDGIHPGGKVAVFGVDAQRAHVGAFEGVQAEEGVDDGGVDSAAHPHEEVVAVLQQKQAVRGESAL